MYRTAPADVRSSTGSTRLFRWAALSTAGRSYVHNEDAFAVHPGSATVVIVDGTGGRSGAGPLSERVAGCFGEAPDAASDTIEPLAASTLRAWRALQRVGPDQHGSGVALAAIRLSPELVAHVHVGDARVYRLRDGELRALTRDHTLWRAMLDEGRPLAEVEEARALHATVITRALLVGQAAPEEIDVGYVRARGGDVLLLCTRGITEAIDDASLRDACVDAAGDLERAAARIVDAAEQSGPHENLTVVLVAIEHAG
jgi:serine/threonine protein phosphatase PrpC